MKKFKKIALAGVSLFGDVFTTMGVYWLGVSIGKRDIAPGLVFYGCTLIAALGMKMLVKAADEKRKTQDDVSEFPYRDASAGLHDRIMELQRENIILKGKRPFPVEHVAIGVLAGVLLITVLTMIAGAFHISPPTSRDAGVP